VNLHPKWVALQEPEASVGLQTKWLTLMVAECQPHHQLILQHCDECLEFILKPTKWL